MMSFLNSLSNDSVALLFCAAAFLISFACMARSEKNVAH